MTTGAVPLEDKPLTSRFAVPLSPFLSLKPSSPSAVCHSSQTCSESKQQFQSTNRGLTAVWGLPCNRGLSAVRGQAHSPPYSFGFERVFRKNFEPIQGSVERSAFGPPDFRK